jgi:phosphoglycolate phosphatase
LVRKNAQPFLLVVFDLDGTLVDTLTDITIAVNRMLRDLSLPPRPEAEVRRLIGHGVEELIGRIVGEEEGPLLDRALELFLDYRAREGARRCRLYPGVRETLENLRDLKIAVVSNGRKMLVDLVLEAVGIADYFQAALGGDSVRCRKPSPCPLLQLTKELGVTAPRTLMVGDMIVDIRTGKAAGITTCAVTYGFGEREDLRAAGADYLIDEIAELLPIVRGSASNPTPTTKKQKINRE